MAFAYRRNVWSVGNLEFPDDIINGNIKDGLRFCNAEFVGVAQRVVVFGRQSDNNVQWKPYGDGRMALLLLSGRQKAQGGRNVPPKGVGTCREWEKQKQREPELGPNHFLDLLNSSGRQC